MLDHGLTMLIFLLTCTNSGFMSGCWQEQLHCHVTWSQLSAWNRQTLMPTKAITVRSHIVWVIMSLIKYVSFQSQWLVTHRSLTLVWAKNSTPLVFLTQTLAFLWFNRLNSSPQWVMSGDNNHTHILHPTLGIAYSLLHQEGQVSFTTYPVITNLFIHTYPRNSDLPVSILTSELNI